MTVPPRPTTTGPSAAIVAVPTPRSAPPGPAHHEALPEGFTASTDSTASADVAGVAWIVREVTHVPGILRLRGGRLSFESTRGVRFDGTPDELVLEVGRSARAGMHVTAGGERLRVCVVRPAGGVSPCRELVDRAADGVPVTAGDADAWALWAPLLAPAPPAAARVRPRRFAFARHPLRAQGAWPT
ncbi:hypothetical protein [Actinomycetospora straminea]|uniref:Htaa protein n=1 Tax=Actinomycetospora straminea TaxID=663607 RepID=A0ABP9DZK4_9PSEU|nr:hypothetical protein [Actinomycetospora straminea]MDD7930934.1 hypothetical protein [Actinomycetospora straminea]